MLLDIGSPFTSSTVILSIETEERKGCCCGDGALRCSSFPRLFDCSRTRFGNASALIEPPSTGPSCTLGLLSSSADKLRRAFVARSRMSSSNASCAISTNEFRTSLWVSQDSDSSRTTAGQLRVTFRLSLSVRGLKRSGNFCSRLSTSFFDELGFSGRLLVSSKVFRYQCNDRVISDIESLRILFRDML